MSDIHTNYIDFRDEHRIYLLDGYLFELVGMLAFTDYDDRNEFCESLPSSAPSPITWYKLIMERMFNGGYYLEEEQPNVFAHRGDVIKGYELMQYLINNENDDPIRLLEDLERYDITAELSDSECSIQICLEVLGHGGFKVESNIGFPLTFIEPEDNRVVLKANDKKVTYSFKKLIITIGSILYALREHLHKPTIDISEIFFDEYFHKVEFVQNPDFFPKFLRLVRIAAEKTKMYWEDFKKESVHYQNQRWRR